MECSVSLVVTEELYTYSLPYMCYNKVTNVYEYCMVHDALVLLGKRETLIPYVQPICSGCAGADDAAAGRDAQQDHAMHHLAYVFLLKLKETVFNNKLYREEDANFQRYRPLPALFHAHGDEQLHFVVAEMEDAVIRTLKIQKPVPPPP